MAVEVNFDGMVGPTHHYGGLGLGNVASAASRGRVSNPRAAALEGLAKVKRLMEMGVAQAVLPPRVRPDVGFLRRLGFVGSDGDVLEGAWRADAGLVSAVSSASSMWAANAATVSPSSDAGDGRLHVTAANLVSQLHRSLECEGTGRVLRKLFGDAGRFAVHERLPGQMAVADEGAANHTRLCRSHGEVGVEVFVYGRERNEGGSGAMDVARMGRQTRAASEAVARLHGLDRERVMFVRQNGEAIAAGVFHNDVAAVANENVVLVHERAWEDQRRVVEEMRRRFERECDGKLIVIEVLERELPLAEAVGTYLFNSQVVTTGGGMVMVAPAECERSERARGVIERIVGDKGNPIGRAEYVDVRQSMDNGGGPACLRLRVVMNEAERGAMGGGVTLDEEKYGRLVRCVERWWREALRLEDLRDVRLLEECRAGVEGACGVLGLRFEDVE